MPKRYTFYGAQELSALADTVYNEVKMANSVFPGNQHEAQLRRDHLIEANATLQALIGQLGIMADLLKQNPESCAGSIILSRSGLPSSARKLSYWFTPMYCSDVWTIRRLLKGRNALISKYIFSGGF